MPWWTDTFEPPTRPARTGIQLLWDPPLPQFLSPLPDLFRLVAFLILAPIIVLCLVDFAGYAVFRTLGFHRRRVRVKAKANLEKSSSTLRPGPRGAEGTFAAPVLTPGAYDADTLLRHRERSASAASAEAFEEWTRTGGQFARVSNVRANRQAGTTTAPTSSVGSASSPHLTVPEIVSPPDSPRNAFAANIGVEGALGYIDTDGEDSGLESGQNSPELSRRGARRGLSSSALGFTPVSPDAVGSKRSLVLDVPFPSNTGDISDRSPKSNDSVTSSWIRLEESSNEDTQAPDTGAAATAAAARASAAAADLEPS